MTRLRHLFLGGGIDPPLWWRPWLYRWRRERGGPGASSGLTPGAQPGPAASE